MRVSQKMLDRRFEFFLTSYLEFRKIYKDESLSDNLESLKLIICDKITEIQRKLPAE